MLALLAAQPAHARAHHSDAWAREHFAAAEHMREALNGRPPLDRTRRDYQRVVNAYRLVYLGAPTSSKADPSVVAVAETLVEMGRRYEDNSILNKPSWSTSSCVGSIPAASIAPTDYSR